MVFGAYGLLFVSTQNKYPEKEKKNLVLTLSAPLDKAECWLKDNRSSAGECGLPLSRAELQLTCGN